MKYSVLLGVLATTCVSSVFAETTMKSGLWELHTHRQIMDGQDMMVRIAAAQAEMQKAMDRMSPQQRQQMEAMLGQRAMPTGNVHRICVSPEMAARDKLIVGQDTQCEPTKTSRSGNKTVFEINCRTEGRSLVGKGESVNSGDTVTTRMDMIITDASGKHTLESEARMRYLGSDCGGIKPADQLVREMQAVRQK